VHVARLELNALSQRKPDRISLTPDWLGSKAGILGEYDDTRRERDPQSMMSRRTAGPGPRGRRRCNVAGTSGALAKQPATPLGPHSTITTTPRDFGPSGPAPHISGTPTSSQSNPSFNDMPNPPRRSSVSTPDCLRPRPGMERAGPYLCGATIPNNGRCDGWKTTPVHVFSTTPTTPRHTRSTSRAGPLSCEHLAFPPGGALRARRHLDRVADHFGGKKINSPNEVVATGTAELVPRPPYGGQLTRASRTVRAVPAPAAAQCRGWDAAGFVAGKRELPTNCYASNPLAAASWCSGTRCRIPTDFVSPEYKSCIRQYGKGTGRYRSGRQERHVRVRCRHRQQALHGKRFPTFWSTA